MKTLYTCTLRACLALLLSVPLQLSAALLQPGELQFVAYQADNPDRFSFVIWQDIEANTEVWFTDSGWLNSGSFRGGEGLLNWQADAFIDAGTVVDIAISAEMASMGTVTNSSQIRLASSGDQLFAFQGGWDSPSLIAGLQMDGVGWQTDATSANTTALPEALNSELSQLHFPAEWDNAVYHGPTSGLSQPVLQQALIIESNWSLSQNPFEQSVPDLFISTDPASTMQKAQAVPNGASLWHWAIGLFALYLLCRRSQKTGENST